jgi:four helix bundle protein
MTDFSSAQYAFERFDVYRVAYDGLRIVVKYRERMRGLPGEIAPQMQRAAVSTVANITEAIGREGNDRKHRLSIARGEANETGAMIEIATLFRVFSESDYQTLRTSYLRVTYMLTALMR